MANFYIGVRKDNGPYDADYAFIGPIFGMVHEDGKMFIIPPLTSSLPDRYYPEFSGNKLVALGKEWDCYFITDARATTVHTLEEAFMGVSPGLNETDACGEIEE